MSGASRALRHWGLTSCWFVSTLSGCLDAPKRSGTGPFRPPPDASLDGGRTEAGVLLPPCDPAADPAACCRPREGRAPCCDPPDPQTLSCPRGATEERAEDGSFTCRSAGTDGIVRAVGPFVAFFGSRVVSYGVIADGGTTYECDPTTARMREMRRHSTGEGDPSPGRVTCSLSCWDTDGVPVACTTPCAQ